MFNQARSHSQRPPRPISRPHVGLNKVIAEIVGQSHYPLRSTMVFYMGQSPLWIETLAPQGRNTVGCAPGWTARK